MSRLLSHRDVVEMSTRGRSTSPHPLHDGDVDLDNGHGVEKSHIKVIQVSNLTRNVVDAHLRTVFGFYGHIVKIDLPIFGKCESYAPLCDP